MPIGYSVIYFCLWLFIGVMCSYGVDIFFVRWGRSCGEVAPTHC